MAYLRTVNGEIRTGLIAQYVEAMFNSRSMPLFQIIGSNMASVDPGTFGNPGTAPGELLSLCNERLVPVLLGAGKKLTERIDVLEAL